MQKRALLAAVLTLVAASTLCAADLGKIPTPMKRAKVGQWVVYKVMGGMEQKQSITAIEGEGDARVVTVKMEMLMNGQPQMTQEQKIPLKDAVNSATSPWANSPDVKISEGKVAVKGKQVDGVIVEYSASGIASKLYMSDAVPVSGIVKMETTAMPEPLMEVVDFGE